MEPPNRQADVDRERSQADPRARALLIWPGLDRLKLARTRGHPGRVARLVGRRTALPHETILGMLGCDPEACNKEHAMPSVDRPATSGLVAGPASPTRRGAPRPRRLLEPGTNVPQLGRAS